VNWGPSRVAANGYAPAVTISKEGYVILVHGTSQYGDALYNSDLNYRVGKIDPYGDQNQSIQWLTADKFLDAGVQSSIAMNENGLIVGVHEPGRGGDGIYYWVGRLVTPDAGRNYDIVWDSGQWGIRYDTGINPHIAINNENDVVSVHQVPDENLLHYRRGRISRGQIAFGESKRYEDSGREPAVALLDNGLVIEVHLGSTGDLLSRIGTLNPFRPDEMLWRNSVLMTGSSDYPYDPAVAAGGSYAVETQQQGVQGSRDEKINYRVAELCQYLDGTLIKGSSEKIYVVLNDYRYHLPDPATFEALQYNWDRLLWISDDEVNAIPEGTPFPSVAPLSGPLRFANGTLFRGSTGNVYVLLNNHRHWIPDEATFEAMGFEWSKIRKSSDAVLGTFPERAPFPSVAR